MRKLECQHTGCSRNCRCKGYCDTHYQQFKKHGVTWDIGATFTLEARLAAKYVVDEASGCWFWTGGLNANGYGYISVRGHGKAGRKPAHRASFELRYGPIPEGLQLDHQCHNRDQSCLGGKSCRHRRCVNPEHLEPATNQQNASRGRAGATARARAVAMTRCKNGHELAPENIRTYANGYRRCKACVREKQRAYDAKRRGSTSRQRAHGPLREVLRRQSRTVWLSCGHVIRVTDHHPTVRVICTSCENGPPRTKTRPPETDMEAAMPTGGEPF